MAFNKTQYNALFNLLGQTGLLFVILGFITGNLILTLIPFIIVPPYFYCFIKVMGDEK